MSAVTKARENVEAFGRRVATIPQALVEACEVPLPQAPEPRTVATTGIGGSEGPARMLASLLATSGVVNARFVPLCAFHAEREPEVDLLVVFSQGLSPNAGLALQSRRARVRWLVTSVGHRVRSEGDDARLASLERSGVEVICMPPGVERGMLARVVGPQVASLLAVRLAAALGASDLGSLPFAEAAGAWPHRGTAPVLPPREVAMITDAVSGEWAFGLRWKLLEALLLPDPPVWDALQLAHGPLQSFFDREVTLLVLETPASGDLCERVATVVEPSRHRIERIWSPRSDALGYFAHAAAIDAIVLETLRARPLDLGNWPARGRDAALYGLTADGSTKAPGSE